jgi:hypothetical protein
VSTVVVIMGDGVMVPGVDVVTVALFWKMVPFIVLEGTVPLMYMVLDVPAGIVPRLNESWVTFWRIVGILSCITTFCASLGPLLVTVMV